MTDEILKKMCKENQMSIAQLEKVLGYGNGALGKTALKDMSGIRVFEIAKYFNVTMEELIEPGRNNHMHDGTEKLRKQNQILIKMQQLQENVSRLYRQIHTLKSELEKLSKEYDDLNSSMQENVQI